MSTGDNPIIIALDVDTTSEALMLIDKIGPAANFYKVGMELYALGGLGFVHQVNALGKSVFLDLKLYDIGETVKRTITQICKSAAPRFLTVHGSPSIVRAAVEGRADVPTKILAVTVLTSWDQSDLTEIGYATAVSDLVEQLARKAVASGADGIICSPLEVARVRRAVGPGVTLITPGVRSAGASKGDQKRVATPLEALQNGADHLVIGRQVTRAENPRVACEQILSEITVRASK